MQLTAGRTLLMLMTLATESCRRAATSSSEGVLPVIFASSFDAVLILYRRSYRWPGILR